MSIRRPWAVRPWAVTVACTILAIGAAFLCLAGAARAAGTNTPVIVDTDMFTSADDVGALSLAFADANVIAVNLNQRVANGQRPIATDTYKCAAAIAAFYGNPGVPIGAQSTPTAVAPNTPDFVGPCGQLDPNPVPGTVPSAVTVDETALTAAADNSVVIICTGYEGNLAALLQANSALVAQKVKMLVIMGGGYPSWTTSPGENNFYGDPAAASYVAANWPSTVPIVYSGQEVGDAVLTGHTVSTSLPAYAPLRVAYEAFVGEGRDIYSYDLTAAYHGIVPSDAALTESAAGTNVVNASNGENTFTPGVGNQFYLSLTNQAGLQGSMESLLDTPGSIPAGTAPTNTAAPVITGTAQMGQTLTASGDAWSPSTAQVTYQWFDCSAINPANCTEISQPTSNTLLLDQSKLGDLTGDLIEVQAQASVAGASSPPVTSATVTVQPPPGPVPANTGPPAISGTAVVGQTLTESHGTWTNSPTGYTYQWEQCNTAATGCTTIAGATGQTYTLTGGDAGHTIVVEERASNGSGSSLPATSAATPVVSAPGISVPANTGAPAIHGNAVAGQTLYESHGSWTGNPGGYTYQWELCDTMGGSCTPISGATSQTYTLTAADVGNTIRVLETATNAGGSSSPAASSATGVVTGQSSGNNPPPPAGSQGVSRKVIHTALMKSLVVRGKGARIRTLKRTHKYVLTFAAPAAGRLVVKWYYKPRHGRKVLVGKTSVRVRHAGRTRVKLVLTRKGRVLFKHSKRLKLTATGSFTPLHERTTSASRKLTLKR